MAAIKTAEELDSLREGGKRLAAILDELTAMVRPGITTDDLENKAVELIAAGGDTGSFLNYRPDGAARPFPANLCVCVNEEIVHGIPNEDPRTLKQGDIVTVDLGLIHNGLFTDSARTVAVGEIDQKAKEFIWKTDEALMAGIDAARPGNHIGDIGYAVESVIKKTPYVIIRELVGHGVGHAVHEEPYVPNFGKPGTGEEIVPGMVLAIEVMLAESGSGKIKLMPDGYTYVTDDGVRSTQIEHTVIITEDGPEIITLSGR